MLKYDINQANQEVIAKIKAARPFWKGVKPAHTVISEFNQGRVLLHAGPPIIWEHMTGPMQGACIGALLYEEWAKNEEDAVSQLESGRIKFIPCHHVNTVGPMGGITSPNMPVLVVKNQEHGNFAYCNLNEGIGKVMRFGAYGEEVQTRLRWMRDELAPILDQVLSDIPEGIDLSAIMAQAITMGDEFHQRNIAASALLAKTLAPLIMKLSQPTDMLCRVMSFLSSTDQFFLNLAMAYCKSVMDAAATIKKGSIVTALTLNG